jgi:hypothetical protein
MRHQSLTNAADAQQKIAFRLQVAIIVDRQCDGFVDCSVTSSSIHMPFSAAAV